MVVREHENQGGNCERRSHKKKDGTKSGTQRKKREKKLENDR